MANKLRQFQQANQLSVIRLAELCNSPAKTVENWLAPMVNKNYYKTPGSVRRCFTLIKILKEMGFSIEQIIEMVRKTEAQPRKPAQRGNHD